MLLLQITVLILITPILGFEGSNEEAAIANLWLSSATQVQGQQSNTLSINQNSTGISQPNALVDRDVTFGPFSHVYKDSGLFQWVFGNATTLLNISISTCISLSDVVGVYQFENGSMKYDATASDIITDLGLGTAKATPARLNARTLQNAQSASNELQAFLVDDVLVKSNLPPPPRSLGSRDVTFNSQGRVFALVVKTAGGLVLGMSAAAIANGDHTTYGQLAAGAIASAGTVALFSICDIIAQDGGFKSIEPAFMQQAAVWVANVFMALLRRLVMLFRGAPDVEQDRWSQAELRAALDQQDVFSAWGTDTTPGSGSSFDIRNFHDCGV